MLLLYLSALIHLCVGNWIRLSVYPTLNDCLSDSWTWARLAVSGQCQPWNTGVSFVDCDATNFFWEICTDCSRSLCTNRSTNELTTCTPSAFGDGSWQAHVCVVQASSTSLPFFPNSYSVVRSTENTCPLSFADTQTHSEIYRLREPRSIRADQCANGVLTTTSWDNSFVGSFKYLDSCECEHPEVADSQCATISCNGGCAGKAFDSGLAQCQACNAPKAPSSCFWYPTCLATSHPCSGDPDEYALTYGYKYCSQYENNLPNFSPEGAIWISAVKVCLQLALVPLLTSQISCAELRQQAFDSHPLCYTNPVSNSNISICDIHQDWWKVIQTARSAIWEGTIEYVKQAIAVMGTCAPKIVTVLSIRVKGDFDALVASALDRYLSVEEYVQELLSAPYLAVLRVYSGSIIMEVAVFGNSTHSSSELAKGLLEAQTVSSFSVIVAMDITNLYVPTYRYVSNGFAPALTGVCGYSVYDSVLPIRGIF